MLLSTESAGEGRNLQFCHVMINLDLPWTPMQIEQRLGRLHRVGQQRDVLLANLVSRGTIEQHVLQVLESKINLFELVVGELDMILGRVSDDFDFEASIFDAYVAAGDDAEFAATLEDLSVAWPGPAATTCKPAARLTLRPFRLHAVLVPGWRVPVDVRRGPRRYPLTLDWLTPLAAYAELRCPHCGSSAPLSAAKTRLGCATCLPGAVTAGGPGVGR